jgi:hypothetical protein
MNLAVTNVLSEALSQECMFPETVVQQWTIPAFWRHVVISLSRKKKSGKIYAVRMDEWLNELKNSSSNV